MAIVSSLIRKLWFSLVMSKFTGGVHGNVIRKSHIPDLRQFLGTSPLFLSLVSHNSTVAASLWICCFVMPWPPAFWFLAYVHPSKYEYNICMYIKHNIIYKYIHIYYIMLPADVTRYGTGHQLCKSHYPDGDPKRSVTLHFFSPIKVH